MLVAKTQTLPAPHLCELDMTEVCLTRVQWLKLEPQGGVRDAGVSKRWGLAGSCWVSAGSTLGGTEVNFQTSLILFICGCERT